MLPTLKPGQDVLLLCWFLKLRVGDMVVFKKNGKEMVKRISKFLDREKMIFVVGDNQRESTDSRHFGWVDKSRIIGKIFFML